MAKKVVKRAPRKGTTVLVKKDAGLPVSGAPNVDVQSLFVQAIARGDVESAERIAMLRAQMKAEWARDQYFRALKAFQRECPIVEKNHKVPNKDKKTTRYSYAAIEDLATAAGPFLDKHGFSWTVKPRQTATDVTAAVYAHHEDGHEEVTEFSVPLDPAAYMSDPQKAAAALTFATRYAFKGAFGIQTKGEDNDAQQDDELRTYRRAPIQQPQEKGPIIYPKKDGTASDAVPVAHEEVKPRSVYEEILYRLKSVSTAPTGQLVAIFSENEKTDYTHEADMAKDNPEELKKILLDIAATGAKRHKAIKGTDAKEAT